MQNRLIVLRDRLRDSYWFIPAILSLAAIILSFATVAIDHSLMGQLGAALGWNFAGSPEGVRTLLSTIAGSMITVVGLVFSLTMVVLTLASQHYGTLIISNFVRDRHNQFVLGTFTATFLYCMLVLRTVRGGEDDIFVPQLSSLISMALAILSLAVLIYFIHHIGYSIRSHTIISSITANLLNAIDDLFPGQIGEGYSPPADKTEEEMLPPDYETGAQPVLSESSGYLQLVNERQLMQTAERENLIIELRFRPGEFVVEGSILGYVYPRLDTEREGRVIRQINDAIYTGAYRSPAQDVELLFGQLVSIALRALSAAINDPYTVVMCIDRLGEALSYLAKHPIPSRYRKDEAGRLRVIARAITFEGMVRMCFDEIRHYGKHDLMIMAHLLRIIRLVGESLHDPQDEAVLHQYAYQVWQETEEQFTSDYARSVLNQKYQAAVETLTN